MTDTYVIMLALLAEPRDAYTYDAATLERVSALLRSTYGGHRELDAQTLREHAMLRATETEISAVLRAKLRVDAETRKAPVAPPPAVAPPTPNGWKVRPRRPVPVLPSGGNADDIL